MPDALALCYHGVSNRWPNSTAVTPEQLRSHIKLFRNRSYVSCRFSDVSSDRRSGRVVSVTFDDAHRSVLTHAFPILSNAGMVGTVFVPTDYPDSGKLLDWPTNDRWLGTEHEAELTCMSWDELRLLADAGWEIGSHSASHVHLSRCSDAQLEVELVGSRQKCEERLGRPCRSIAYPYGDYDDRVIARVREAGYAVGASVPTAIAYRAGRFESPRVGIYRHYGPSAVRLRISPAFRRLRKTKLLSPIAAIGNRR